MQEVSLFNAAYDGDVEGLNNALRIGVPVDFMSPVREFVMVSGFYLYKIVCSIGTSFCLLPFSVVYFYLVIECFVLVT